jgi:hypothetical protein
MHASRGPDDDGARGLVSASCLSNLSKFVIARRDHRRARRPPYPKQKMRATIARG